MIEDNLYDERRQRSIPVGEYPSSDDKFLGVILFSVGFGGNRDGYGYLARSWSSLGFLVAVVEHVGSNLAVLQQLIGNHPRRHYELARRVGEKVREPQELLDRPYDLHYVAEHYRHRFGREVPLGLAGHSFGAYTVCAASGCTILMPNLADESRSKIRLKNPLRPFGLVALSPQPPGQILDAASMAALDFPSLFVTGTLDSGMPAGVDYRQRLEVYRHLPPATRSLALLEGADHMSFAGVGLRARPVMDATVDMTGRFWRNEPLQPTPEGALTTYWNEEALCH